VWLTLGVTAQQISCLHTAVAPAKFHEDHAPVASPLPVVES
jgi:flagellar biogenesis protein FliO